jgi:hypothetical protein
LWTAVEVQVRERGLLTFLGKAAIAGAVLTSGSWGAFAWASSLQPLTRSAAQHPGAEQLRFSAARLLSHPNTRAPGERIRFEWGFEAQLDVPEALRVAELRGASTARLLDGRYLHWTFEKNDYERGAVASMTLAWTPEEAGTFKWWSPPARFQPPGARPNLAGHRFVSATGAWIPGSRYNSLGLLHSAPSGRTQVVAFSDLDGSFSPLMSLPGEFSGVSSQTEPHGTAASIYLVSSPTGQVPMRLLVYGWSLDASPARRGSLRAG